MKSRACFGITAVALALGGCASILGLPDEYHGGSDSSGDDAGLDQSAEASSNDAPGNDAPQQGDASQEADSTPDVDALSEPFEPETGEDGGPADAPPDSNAEAGIVGLTSGQIHACALVQLAGGVREVHCWGQCNSVVLGADCVDAGLATGSVLDENLLPIEDVVDLAAGAEHTCILRPGGKVQCWGHNNHLQVGNGHTDNEAPHPSSVLEATSGLPLSGIVLLAAHGDTTCGANADGEVYCWGVSPIADEALGHATKVATLSANLKKLAVGTSAQVCAIDGQDKLLCWGRNGSKEASAGKVDAGAFVTTPVQIPTAKTVLDVGLGHEHSCAAEGSVIQCWGAWNDGTPSPGLDPIPLSAVPGNYVQVEGGYFGNCARSDAGKVMCFGENAGAWVGSPQTVAQKAPYFVKGANGVDDLQGMKFLASAGDFSCAASDTEVHCWGDFTFEEGVYSCSQLLADGGLDPRCSEKAVLVQGLPTF